MAPNRFEHLLTLVGPLIQKETTRFKEPISAPQRLALTLRFLWNIFCDLQSFEKSLFKEPIIKRRVVGDSI